MPLLQPILFVIGTLLMILAAAMFVPALLDWAMGHSDWQVFATAATVTLFVGVSLTLANRAARFTLSVRQTFVLTTVSWVVITAFAALPFALSEQELAYVDAYFEAMSGVTTTGSTVMIGLDNAPPGILLWRSLLQWLGGIGIIVMAIAILPLLRVGGMQLFRTESSEKTEKVLPRAAQLSASIAMIYIGLTALWAAMLWSSGMTPFEAICHAMTTIATGGYSTSDSSIAHFNSASIDIIITFGMLAGGIPFVLYLRAFRGEVGALIRDSQVQWFIGFSLFAILVLALWQAMTLGTESWLALRYAAFNAVSIITGTGFASTDYGQWGPAALMMFFFLKFVGGCTGSTTGAIKIFRFQVLFQVVRIQMGHLLRPHAVLVAHFNGKPVPEAVAASVLGFLFLFIASVAVVATALSLFGLDFLTSLSGAATSIANVGPGLGPVIGPSGNFSSLPDGAKWLLSAAMLLGRLELFTVLVLFLPAFWRG